MHLWKWRNRVTEARCQGSFYYKEKNWLQWSKIQHWNSWSTGHSGVMTTWLLLFEPFPALPPQKCVCTLGGRGGDRPESTVSLNWLTSSTFQYKNTKKKTESPQFTVALVSLSTRKVLGGTMVSGDLNLYFIYFMLRPVESKNSLEWRIKQQSGIAYSVFQSSSGTPGRTSTKNLENFSYSVQCVY